MRARLISPDFKSQVWPGEGRMVNPERSPSAPTLILPWSSLLIFWQLRPKKHPQKTSTSLYCLSSSFHPRCFTPAGLSHLLRNYSTQQSSTPTHQTSDRNPFMHLQCVGVEEGKHALEVSEWNTRSLWGDVPVVCLCKKKKSSTACVCLGTSCQVQVLCWDLSSLLLFYINKVTANRQSFVFSYGQRDNQPIWHFGLFWWHRHPSCLRCSVGRGKGSERLSRSAETMDVAYSGKTFICTLHWV